MPILFYIIPMVAGPYSRANPQRPDYVDEIQCNWSGHNVDSVGVYICMVNTSDAKHADLKSRDRVNQLPPWTTLISGLPTAPKAAISTWCTNHGIIYDATDTIGQFLLRVLQSDLFGLGLTSTTTQFQNLNQAQKDKIDAVYARFGVTHTATETLRVITRQLGPFLWPGNDRTKVNVDEF